MTNNKILNMFGTVWGCVVLFAVSIMLMPVCFAIEYEIKRWNKQLEGEL